MTGHMVPTRMMTERASSSQQTITKKPSRLPMPASSRPRAGTEKAAQKEISRPPSTKTVRGVPTLPSPKACTDCTTPLRTR